MHFEFLEILVSFFWKEKITYYILYFFQSECIDSAKSEPIKTPQHLDALLDYLLNPEKDIKDQDTIDWCRWLVGGGRSYEDFASNGMYCIVL